MHALNEQHPAKSIIMTTHNTNNQALATGRYSSHIDLNERPDNLTTCTPKIFILSPQSFTIRHYPLLVTDAVRCGGAGMLKLVARAEPGTTIARSGSPGASSLSSKPG